MLVHLGEQAVVVELKAISGELSECEEKQLKNYIRILGADYGLLINFQLPSRRQTETCIEIRQIKSW